MTGNPFTQLVFDLFIISAILITAYTCNFYYLVFLANKRNKVAKTIDLGTPSVTIQLPIYNEKYVAKRLVDAVCAMDLTLNNNMFDTVNIASGIETTIRELAETLKRISGFRGKLFYNTERPEGISNRAISNERLRALGWRPHYTLEDALTETYEWYSNQ